MYIAFYNKYGNRTCILSALSRPVYVVYAYMNQALFLNIVATRKMFSSKFFLKIISELYNNQMYCYSQLSFWLICIKVNVPPIYHSICGAVKVREDTFPGQPTG